MTFSTNSDSLTEKLIQIGKMEWPSFLTLLESRRSEDDLESVRRLLYARFATDLEHFAKAYFPHYCPLEFNDLHRDVFGALGFGDKAIRRARAAPRGYAKSTLEALIKPIHDVCYGLERFIVIFSNTQDQANQKLRDIRAEVLTNARLASDYGLHFKTRTPGETQYTVYAGDHACLFASFGSGTEVRGVRFGAYRPSKIVVDDSEHSEEVLNEALRKKDEDWYFQVVSKLGTKETNIHVIGTLLHPESLLAKLIKNPAYDGKIYKAIESWSERQDLWDEWTRIYTNLDNDRRVADSMAFYEQHKTELLKGTKVLWPERESYLDLMKELIETGKRAFMKEKQNEPIGGDEQLFEKIHWYRETAEGFLIESTGAIIPWNKLKDAQGRWLNAYGALDPATGQTKAKPGKLGDFSSIITGIALPVQGKEFRQRIFVHHDWTKRAGPSTWMSKIYELNEEFGYSKFAVETNLYRDLLMPNLEAERKSWQDRLKKEVKVPFYDVVNVDNKEKRIHTLEPKITHGWILFRRGISEEAIRQVENYPHGDHDDFLDCLEVLNNLVHGRYRAEGINLGPFRR